MTLVAAATESERGILGQALSALQHAAGHLSAVDVSNAEVNLAEVRYRPLTKVCIEAATQLRQLLDQEGAGWPTDENVGRVPAGVTQLSHADGDAD